MKGIWKKGSWKYRKTKWIIFWLALDHRSSHFKTFNLLLFHFDWEKNFHKNPYLKGEDQQVSHQMILGRDKAKNEYTFSSMCRRLQWELIHFPCCQRLHVTSQPNAVGSCLNRHSEPWKIKKINEKWQPTTFSLKNWVAYYSFSKIKMKNFTRVSNDFN